jgi:hypothetical protein
MANDAAFLEPSGPVFTAPFSAQTLTTNPIDLFCVVASSLSRVVIREVRLGQYTEFGDAQAELLSLTMMVGSTAGSSGTAITPRNVKTHTGAPTAGSSVTGPSTTLASTTSVNVHWADSWNVAAGLLYSPLPPERMVIQPGEIFNLRMSAPADAMTLNGTLVFQEIGKVP